ncbi:orotidine-5'-phosphate decarboxylase [bacterium]|nr:orotidine-5'-phosphate decarboxylase [bacterium]MBT6778960.1 orotidine-5'-phosphate decarboxylase [bacterium]
MNDTEVDPRKYIIKALDDKPLDDENEALDKYLREVIPFMDYVGIIKIGKRAFTKLGPRIVKGIQKLGFDIFLDLKFNDIPETVKSAVYEATCLGVQIINVHAMGGTVMMEYAVAGREEALKEHPELSRPLLIAVTVLTSWSQKRINEELLIPGTINEIAEHFAIMAKNCRFDGIVCSINELQYLQSRCHLPRDFIYITPGTRPDWHEEDDDQERTATPEIAIRNGTSGMVMGRPLATVEAAKKSYDEVEKALIAKAAEID